jgi:hypothetical protein
MRTSITISTLCPRFTATVLLSLLAAHNAWCESAMMGWQAISTTGFYVSQVRMVGPTARNKYPEKRGVFKGEFLGVASWQPKLTSVYKLSLGNGGELQSRKVEFTITPVATPETAVVNGIKMIKTRFETEALAFEPDECFVLVFKAKAQGQQEKTEIITLHITGLFVPS